MNSWLSRLAAAAMSVWLAACGGRAAEPAPIDPPTAKAAAAPDLTIDPEAMKSITVETLAEHPVARTLNIAGKIQFDEDRLVRVLAPLAGQVVDLRVKVGDPVRKGEALCAINSREATAAIGEHVESHKDLEIGRAHV